MSTKNFDNFYKEIQDTFNGYFVDYKIDEENEDILVLSFKIDCDAVIAINKNTDEVVLSFADGGLFYSTFFDQNDYNNALFIISDIFKTKIKSCNYKGMH